MWLEYIRYRFRLHRSHDLLELTQLAALEGLRNSPRCRGWRVLPAADDPSLLVLEIEWDPGTELIPFRGSEEFATIHSALSREARSLDEAEYTVNARLLRQILGGPDTLFRLAEDIVVGILDEPLLRWRFQSADGGKRGRLGLWLLEVLGGPDLFSSSFPDASTRDGPLAHERLDLEERERLLEIAADALPSLQEEQSRSVVSNLRAHLPLHPPPHSKATPARLLAPGVVTPADAEVGARPAHAATSAPDGSGEPPSSPEASLSPGPSLSPGLRRSPDSEVRPSRPSEAPDAALFADAELEQAAAASAPPEPRSPADGLRVQTGVRPLADEVPAAQAAGHPWPGHPRGTPTFRGRASGRWPRWRARIR